MTGRGLPLRLANLLTGRARLSLAGVEAIATGPAGEWLMRFLDGACRCGNLPAAAFRRLQALQSQPQTIGSMSFGGVRDWAFLCSTAAGDPSCPPLPPRAQSWQRLALKDQTPQAPA